MENTVKLNKLNSKISSGKEVENPSDDPVAKRRIMHEERVQRQIDAFNKNVITARSHLEEAHNAMSSIHDIINSVKSLTLQMANDTVNDKDRTLASDDVTEAIEDIIGYANSEIDGFYIFGGYQTGEKPFEDNNEAVPDASDPDAVLYGAYRGDDFARTLEIGPSVFKKIAFPGSEFLTGTITTGGINVIERLQELVVNLRENDADEIRDRISELDASLEQVSRFQSEAGILLQEVEITDAVLQTNLLQSQIRKSEIEDLDISKAFTEFSAVKTALDTTMSTTSQILKVSLLNYLS